MSWFEYSYIAIHRHCPPASIHALNLVARGDKTIYTAHACMCPRVLTNVRIIIIIIIITREMQSINGVSLRVLDSLFERIVLKTFES